MLQLTTAPRSMRNAPAAILQSTETQVIATWNGGQFTNTELSTSLRMRRPRTLGDITFEQIFNLPVTKQRELVRDMAYELILYQKAKSEGLTEKPPHISETLHKYRQQILARLYYQREVEPQLRQLDEKSAREYYESHKELYVTPAQTAVKNLHLSTYEQYTARAGDTLDSIAYNISGTTEAATRILRGTLPFYHRRVAPEFSSEVPTVELHEGEVLLVPVTEETITSKTRLAQNLRRKLMEGANVDEILATYSEPGKLAPPPQPFVIENSNASPQLKEAVGKAKGTSVTEVVRTPYGLDVLYIQDRISTRVLSFQDVRDQLISQVTSDTEAVKTTVENARREVLTRLAKQLKLDINEEALRRKDYAGPDPMTGSTPIVTAPGFTYTLDEFLNDLLPTGKSWQASTAEEKIEAARNSPAVGSYLVMRASENLGLDKTAIFEQEMHSKEILEISSEYLRTKLQKEFATISDAQLRTYYESHLDKYTSPSQVVVREISKRVNLGLPPDRKVAAIEEARKALSAIRSKVSSLADFEQIARRESEAISSRSRGGLIGRVPETFRGEAFRNQLQQMQPGAVSEPFLYGNEVMIVRLDERTPPVTPPFEEVLGRLRNDYVREVPKKRTEEVKQQQLDEAGFKLLF
ncbi:MAG: peptidyl-prolyl cis-trans isomerase [Candidatus Sumerlaeaceae bacterium]